MTMNAMDDYLRARGFDIERKYLPESRKYRFTLTKDGFSNYYFWEYPHGNVNSDNQRVAMDAMIEDMNAYIALHKISNVPCHLTGNIDDGCRYIEEDIKMHTDILKKPFRISELNNHKLKIKKVHFNDPMTIVIWSDGTKTFVKAHNEPFDPEKGLAMAISKKFLGNKYNYSKEFKKWLE